MTGALLAFAVLAALGAFLPDLAETHGITKYPLLGDSYQTIDQTRRAHAHGGHRRGCLFVACEEAGRMVLPEYVPRLRRPLVQTFRRMVVGLPKAPFAPDEPRDPVAARALLLGAGYDQGYLVARHDPGSPRPTDSPRGRGSCGRAVFDWGAVTGWAVASKRGPRDCVGGDRHRLRDRGMVRDPGGRPARGRAAAAGVRP